jgi:hypothetical protein
MTRKTRAEWVRQGAERKTHITSHYFWDARLAPPSLVKGYSSNEISARGNAYRRIGLELFNKVVIIDERTGKTICELRRDPRTGFIDVQDERYVLLMLRNNKK